MAKSTNIPRVTRLSAVNARRLAEARGKTLGPINAQRAGAIAHALVAFNGQRIADAVRDGLAGAMRRGFIPQRGATA